MSLNKNFITNRKSVPSGATTLNPILPGALTSNKLEKQRRPGSYLNLLVWSSKAIHPTTWMPSARKSTCHPYTVKNSPLTTCSLWPKDSVQRTPSRRIPVKVWALERWACPHFKEARQCRHLSPAALMPMRTLPVSQRRQWRAWCLKIWHHKWAKKNLT